MSTPSSKQTPINIWYSLPFVNIELTNTVVDHLDYPQFLAGNDLTRYMGQSIIPGLLAAISESLQ